MNTDGRMLLAYPHRPPPPPTADQLADLQPDPDGPDDEPTDLGCGC